MDPASSRLEPATSSAAAVATPPSPTPVVPSSPDPHHRAARGKRPVSQGSVDSAISSQSHQDYLDSLVVPTKEEFEQIAEIQQEREAAQKRIQREKQRQSLEATRPQLPPTRSRPRYHHHGSLSSRLGFGRRANQSEDGVRDRAATVIQRTYRGYRARREMKGLGIDASTRWVHAIREAQWREMTAPRARATHHADESTTPERPSTAVSGPPGSRSSTARQNWKKVSTIARHAGGDVDADTSSSSSSSSSSSDSDTSHRRKTAEQRALERKRKEEAKARRKQEAKMMGLQYFLEMVDLKHRYGANLRVYHEVWKRAETNENFFYWLDHGEGKNLDLEACPREQLEREQVRYLSREERQYYLVQVDDEGRLCWAKNGARIDTSRKWKDSIHGIVPSDDPTPAYSPLPGNQTALLGDATTDSSLSSRSSSISSSSSIASVNAARYAETSLASPTKKISHHLSGTTILNKLLRKTVRKNTWIFVADTSFRLYVGIKNSGAFQHSSFLQGSRISAAGLIRIRDGRLTSLSPLSGHYRPPASNFRAFVKSLKEAGVDMSRVSVSKSYAVLVGLEAYLKVRKKAGDVFGKAKRHKHGKKGSDEEVQSPRLLAGPTTKDGEEASDDALGPRTDTSAAARPENHHSSQANHQDAIKKEKEEEGMREENRFLVEVMQKLDLGTGVTEPRGGVNSRGEASAPASAPHPDPTHP